MITEAQSLAYIASGGSRCPVCGSSDVEGDSGLMIEGGCITQKITCLSCGQRWQDVYRLSDVQECVGDDVTEEIRDEANEGEA